MNVRILERNAGILYRLTHHNRTARKNNPFESPAVVGYDPMFAVNFVRVFRDSMGSARIGCAVVDLIAIDIDVGGARIRRRLPIGVFRHDGSVGDFITIMVEVFYKRNTLPSYNSILRG